MLKKFIFLFAVILFTFSAVSAQEETEPANDSAITGTQIPSGALRVLPSSYPKEINEAFENLISQAKGKVVQGEREVLVWTQNSKKSDAPDFIKKIQTEWQTNGWKYEMGGRDGDLEVFGLYSEQPTRRAVLGFFVWSDDALVLSLMEILPLSAENAKASTVKTKIEKPIDANNAIKNSSVKILDVGRNEDFVNVMGNEMPVTPTFPAVAKKAGYVRGYVKNVSGEPIAGAKLGLKSARIYDAYLANSAETDATGYYEIKIPTGGAKFDYAGLVRDIGRGKKGAIGLHPADGNLSESYPAASGGIENFVALPYGIGDAAGVSQNAKYRGNYYGGSFMLRYFIAPPEQNPDDFAGMLAAGSEIVVTLVPRTIVFDGSKNIRVFEIRKKIEDSSLGEFFICNVPLGEYELAVRHPNGKFLKMRQKNPTNSNYGITPQETNESASLIFNPLSTDAKTAVASRGNWTDLEIIVER